MEENIIKFHTLARKYVIDRLNEFEQISNKIRLRYLELYRINEHDHLKVLSDFESDENVKHLIHRLNSTYPNWIVRREILRLMLIKVESILPENYILTDEIEKTILLASKSIKISKRINFSLSHKLIDEICDDEKQKFDDYIKQISNKDMERVEIVPYRVVLTVEKISTINNKIDAKWYSNEKRMCFKREDFEVELEVYKIIDILKKHKINKIYEINTGGIDTASYEMDLDAFSPYNIDGFNIYWCTDEMDWMLIKDHEGYYFAGGEWFIQDIKDSWKYWDEFEVRFT